MRRCSSSSTSRRQSGRTSPTSWPIGSGPSRGSSAWAASRRCRSRAASSTSVGSYGRVGGSDDAYRANKADYKAVLPGYFEAMEIRHLSGRTFERLDNREEALDVAIIDRKFAKRVFGEEDPLGADLLVDHFNEKTFSLERLPVRIVGVVDNVRSSSLAAEGRETVYVPYIFNSFLPLTLRRADRCGSREPDRAHPRRSGGHGPGRADRRTVNARADRLERDVADAVPAGAPRRVRRPGAGPGVARPLRRDLVFGEAADA